MITLQFLSLLRLYFGQQPQISRVLENECDLAARAAAARTGPRQAGQIILVAQCTSPFSLTCERPNMLQNYLQHLQWLQNQ